MRNLRVASSPLVFLALCVTLPAQAQQPRIAALFPAGAKAGETVEVAVRGGGMVGAKSALITGLPGVSAELTGNDVKVDEKAKPLFQAKCTSCHEARSPANRSMSPEQWASTVDRMINSRGADIPKPDRDTIVGYLQAQAKAGQISLKVHVAKDAAPGMREIRIVTENGVSTAYLFEVGSFPELNVTGPIGKPELAQKFTFPVIVNGTLAASGEKDYFVFEAKKGQHLAFNLKGFRLNTFAQTFFNPVLYLYDAQGRELTKNLGKFGLDPALEFTAPEDGTYYALVRDMLWKGSPASVYRLAVGPLIADGLLSPSSSRPGVSISARLVDMGDGSASEPFSVQVPEGADGVTQVSTPMGDATLLVRDLPERGGANTASATTPAPLPGLFRGTIAQPGATETFRVTATTGKGGMEVYAVRLGSPLRARVLVKNAQGKTVVTRDAQGGDDLKIPNAFPGPGEYTVEITDADGGGGPTYAYCWEALDGAPDFTLSVAPDSVNIPPGGSLPVLVRVTRRENLIGPIALTIAGLPPGVTVSRAIIPPDDDKAVLVFSAVGGAALVNREITILGMAPGSDGKTTARRARPLEIVRYNGQQRLTPRNSQIVATTSDPPPFTLELVGGSSLQMKPNQEVKVTVRVNRQPGFNGDVVLGFLGVPPGLGGANFINVQKGKTEATFTFRADGNAPFLKPRPFPNLAPMELVIVGFQSGGDNLPLNCTAPLPLISEK